MPYGYTPGQYSSFEWSACGIFDKYSAEDIPRASGLKDAYSNRPRERNVYLQLPLSIYVRRYSLESRIDCCADEMPTSWTLYGMQDGFTWEVIDTENITTPWTIGETRHFTAFSRPVLYSFLRLQSFDLVSLGELRFFGSRSEDTYPVQNRYPPIPMRTSNVTLSNQPYGSGYYEVTTSSTTTSAVLGFDSRPFSWTGTQYFSSTAPPQPLLPQILTYVNGIHLKGHWLQIRIPDMIYLHSYTISVGAQAATRFPFSFYMLGSLDGAKWDVLDYVSDENTWFANVPMSKTYTLTEFRRQLSYFRLVFTLAGLRGSAGVYANAQVDILELILNGSPGKAFFCLRDS